MQWKASTIGAFEQEVTFNIVGL